MKQKLVRVLAYVIFGFALISLTTWIVNSNEFTEKINYLIWFTVGMVLSSFRAYKIK